MSDDYEINHDPYAFVPPHRRDNVRLRIRMLELFEKGELSAAEAAGQLRLNASTFAWLHRAWKIDSSPHLLGGAGRPERSHSRVTVEQQAVIEQAAGEMKNAIVERVVERALEIASETETEMPTWSALTRYVGEALIGHLPSSSPAFGSDLVIEHAVVDLPVADEPTSGAFMPIGSFVVGVTGGSILGLTLEREMPSAATTARAIKEAILRLPNGSATGHAGPRLYMDMLPGADWLDLKGALVDCGFEVVGSEIVEVLPPRAMVRLIGRKINQIRMMPRFGRRPFEGRPATLPSGADALSLAEAERYLRARWIEPTGQPPMLAIEPKRRSALLLRLAGLFDRCSI